MLGGGGGGGYVSLGLFFYRGLCFLFLSAVLIALRAV